MKTALYAIGVIVILGGTALFFFGERSERDTTISFEECVALGNPVTDTYPRQCEHDGRVYFGELTHTLSLDQSRTIARETAECTEHGDITDQFTYNPDTRKWLFEIDVSAQVLEGCRDLCIVNEQTKTAAFERQCELNNG